MRLIIAIVATCAVVAPSIAFGQGRGPTSISPATKTIAASLDSCGALPLRPPSGRKAAKSNATPTRMQLNVANRAFPAFSLIMPKGSLFMGLDAATGARRYSWPSCEHCEIRTRIKLDSTGKGIDGEVALLMESQRVIDSINHDPKANGRDFDEYDLPPMPFRTPSERGYYIERSCGDCAEASLLFGRSGAIADISIHIDDDVPQLVRLECEMTVVGKTFQWRERK